MWTTALTLACATLAWRCVRGAVRDKRSDSSPTPADDAARCWRPPGRATTIYGHLLADGMLWIGRGLPARDGRGLEPALIDPGLPIAHGVLDREGRHVIGCRGYDDMPPAGRAAFLAWLAGGRRDPAAGLVYVRLFLAGLERRVLAAGPALPLAAGERTSLLREVLDLRGVYGGDRRVAGQTSALLGALAPGAGTPAAAPTGARPATHRVGDERAPSPASAPLQGDEVTFLRTPLPFVLLDAGSTSPPRARHDPVSMHLRGDELTFLSRPVAPDRLRRPAARVPASSASG